MVLQQAFFFFLSLLCSHNTSTRASFKPELDSDPSPRSTTFSQFLGLNDLLRGHMSAADRREGPGGPTPTYI